MQDARARRLRSSRAGAEGLADDLEAAGGRLAVGVERNLAAFDRVRPLVDGVAALFNRPRRHLADLRDVVARLTVGRDALAVLVDGARPGVVRGQRQLLVAVVAIEQRPQ